MAFKDIDILSHAPQGFVSTLGGGTFRPRGMVGIDGIEETTENMRLLAIQAISQSVGASHRLAEKLLDLARHHVPYKDGHLFNSGKIISNMPVGGRGVGGRFVPGTVTEFLVSFGDEMATYAAYIHENPDGKNFVQNPPNCPPEYRGSVKTSHYLSLPAEIIAKEIRPTVAEAVQSAVVAAIARAKAQSASGMRPRLVKRT